KNASERKEFRTTYGAPIETAYTDDARTREAAASAGLPGEPPLTRGTQHTMYRGRLWTMRQYAGFGTAEDTNARFRSLLAHGQTCLSVALDLPRQVGYDHNGPRVAGEVWRVGVSIATVEDMEHLFDAIPL